MVRELDIKRREQNDLFPGGSQTELSPYRILPNILSEDLMGCRHLNQTASLLENAFLENGHMNNLLNEV
jgi:hypothetical protein